METDYCLIALTTNRKIGKEFEERLTDLVSLNRDFQLVRVHTSVSQVKRWLRLKNKHGLASELLNFDPEKTLKNTGDSLLNSLTSAVPDLTDDYSLDLNSNYIELTDCVWHMTSWTGLVKWFTSKGIPADYISCEDRSSSEFLFLKLTRNKDNLKIIYRLLEEGKYKEAKTITGALLLM